MFYCVLNKCSVVHQMCGTLLEFGTRNLKRSAVENNDKRYGIVKGNGEQLIIMIAAMSLQINITRIRQKSKWSKPINF